MKISIKASSFRVLMNEQMDRTKVVIRHLPPMITRDALVEQIDHGGFVNRYYWLSFSPGKISHKHFSYSRAYVDFKKPEDVIEFAEFFDGHVFVNEKGSRFKTIVEYAPSQRVPDELPMKDGCEGTIFKDPKYLDFLDFLAKPVENLPSAEIQMERREAEKAAAITGAPIVTPLMDFVRQKRAAKGVSRRAFSKAKSGRKAGGSLPGGLSNNSSKRSSDNKKVSSTMYVLKDSTKTKSGKVKASYIIVKKRADQQLSENPVNSSQTFPHGSPGESGFATIDARKNKILLLRGNEKEIYKVSGSISQQQDALTPIKDIASVPKQSLQRDSSSKSVGSILKNKDTSTGQSAVRSVIQFSTSNKDRRPPRTLQSGLKDTTVSGDKICEKNGRRTRARDRPDRGVWTVCRAEGLHTNDECLSYSASQSSQFLPDSSEGSHRHSCHGPVGLKNSDGSSKAELSNRGGFSSYGFHEKGVWKQKSATGS